MVELTIVGEEQSPRGFDVQPSDRLHPPDLKKRERTGATRTSQMRRLRCGSGCKKVIGIAWWLNRQMAEKEATWKISGRRS